MTLLYRIALILFLLPTFALAQKLKPSLGRAEWDSSSQQLIERWRTPLQKGYISDFIVADLDDNGELELLVAMRFQEKNILQRGHSALMVFKLQQ